MSQRLEQFIFDQAALAECAREPIHIPGRIQPNGALLGLDATGEHILFASENAPDVLGVPLGALLDATTASVFGEEMRAAIVRAAQGADDGVPNAVPSTLSTRRIEHHAILVHRRDDRIIVELVREAESPLAELPLSNALAHIGGVVHGQTRAAKRFASPPEHHAEPLAATLSNSESLRAMCDRVVQELQAITGYDRVMFYKFHVDDHGEVIAEARRDGLESFLGLHYPAADIPPQARALYRETPLRVLFDVTAPPIAVVGAPSVVAERPLDMGGALLRGMSPVHLQYLHNMGVRASLVVSVVVDDRLWGLVACHHYSAYWPDAHARLAAHVLSRFLASEVALQQTSAYAEARERANQLHRPLLIALIEGEQGYAGLPPLVRTLVPCDGVAVTCGDGVFGDGVIPPADRVRAIGQWLDEQSSSTVRGTSGLSREAPQFADLIDDASGVLSIDIAGTAPVKVVWFRGEIVRRVRWAGKPEKEVVDTGGIARLLPRSSFAVWEAEARGLADPWTLQDLAVAESVRSVLIGVLFDLINARQRIAELELIRIRRAVDSTSAGIALQDEHDRLIYANPALHALLGSSALPQVGDARLVPLFYEAGGTAGSYRELEVHDGDGRAIPVEVRVDPILSEHGALEGTSIIVQDLREQRALDEAKRQLEQRLLQTQKLESLGVMAGGIAHDFNNLLTAILGNAAMMRKDISLGAIEQQSVEEILSAGKAAAELCRQLLAYAGRARYLIRPIDVNGLVQEMSGMLKIAIGRLLTVRFDLAFGLPAVNADVAQLRQVIMNLIVNASDAIGDAAGTITLATRQVDATRAWLDEFIEGDRLDEGPYVAIEVTDTGIGMSPDTARRIFEPFFTTKFTGRGLGLSAVLGIVRGHGGAIRVQSAEGIGTTFLVLLPGSVDAPQAERSAPPQKLPSGAGRLVLVVDDDDGVRYLTKRILETLGFEVLQAEDGEHGLALFQANAGRAALALVDLTMPRMGGAELLRRLRALDGTLPVILMSGYSETDALALTSSWRNIWFVQKPFAADALIPVVAMAVDAPRVT